MAAGAAERKTPRSFASYKGPWKDRDTDNFVYTLVVGSLSEPVQRMYNFPLHTHEKIFHIMVAIIGLDTVCLVR
jgi:hypothetical protein